MPRLTASSSRPRKARKTAAPRSSSKSANRSVSPTVPSPASTASSRKSTKTKAASKFRSPSLAGPLRSTSNTARSKKSKPPKLAAVIRTRYAKRGMLTRSIRACIRPSFRPHLPDGSTGVSADRTVKQSEASAPRPWRRIALIAAGILVVAGLLIWLIYYLTGRPVLRLHR